MPDKRQITTALTPPLLDRQKASLNRAILDQGLGEFRRQLDYKLARRDRLLVRVAPAYTS